MRINKKFLLNVVFIINYTPEEILLMPKILLSNMSQVLIFSV